MLLAVPLLLAMFCFWQALPGSLTSSTTAEATVTQPTHTEKKPLTRRIDEIRPGMRVLADNPDLEQELAESNITMTSPQALKLPDIDLLFFSEAAFSLDSLITKTAERRLQKLRFHAIAVGIDLSDLGYKQGTTIKELFIQDLLDDDNLVDPVFIAGLPVIP